MTYDAISPSHYHGDRKFEPIDVIEDWALNYRLGCALKYIARNGRKPGEDPAEGLKKAIWYLSREIESLQAGSPYRAEYEDVIDYYGQSTEIDTWPDVDTIGDTGFSEAGVPIDAWGQSLDQALEDEWAAWEEFDAWDPSVGPVEPVLTQAEVDEVLSRKALHQFASNEVVATIDKRGLILGVKKDGSTCELGPNGRCK